MTGRLGRQPDRQPGRQPGRRPTRRRTPKGRSRVGERFEAEVGPVAHGGHCVVRLPEPESRVVFTRHALPGERVVVEITEGADGDRFWRGDAVEVLVPVEARVEPPCPVSGPGGCGGCDFQHVAVPDQRALKTAVVREQLVRLGGLLADDPVVTGLEVQGVPVPGRADDGLRWRTRQAYVALSDGGLGMRRHRSHDVVPVADCLIEAPGATRVVVPAEPGATSGGRHGGGSPGQPPAMTSREGALVRTVSAAGSTHAFTVERDGFWQVHPEAPRVLVETVVDLLAPQPGERVLDLYSGVGLFARFLADRVGPGTRLVAVEADAAAMGHARANLAGHEGAVAHRGAVDRVLATAYDEPFDLVVLDPPREGARRVVVEQVVDRRPRAVAYVACDPAALGRDVAIFAEQGYRLEQVRAFDLFPMTHHVECVALLTGPGSGLG